MLQLQIENVAHCNAACVFCPYPTMEREKGTMEMGLFTKIIDEAAALPLISHVTLTGLGEPLVDRRLIERLKHVRKRMASVPLDLYTNGTFLRREMADALKQVGISRLYVSLNAANAIKRQEIMKLGDFDKVCRQIDYAISIGLPVQVKAVLSKDLMEGDEVDQFIERWGGRVEEGGNAFVHLEGNWAGWDAYPPMRTMPRTPCHRALTQIMVLWDGRVSLCCFDGEGKVILGDLNRQTIKEVFNGEKALAYRTAHIEGRRNEMELCKQCTAI